MKNVIFVVLGLVLLLSGCTKPAPPVQNVSGNVSTSPNTTSPIISQNETSSTPVPPWPNIDVFTDETAAINVTTGQEFIVRYAFYNSISATFQVEYAPEGVITLLENQVNTLSPLSLDGNEWFLFKAEASGSTNITIQEQGHLVGFVSQKTFTINVAPPKPNISGNSTLNPWPDKRVFADATKPANVAVGQEFVISYSQFTSSNIDFQPADIVVVESKQFVQNPGALIPDGTTWILFKAVATGSTKVSVTETTRFGDPMQTKTFTVNVGTAAPNPVSVVSVAMTGPVNPGGPPIEIALKNVSSQPIVSLNATLDLNSPRPFVFTFPTPVLPSATASAKMILIGGGYSSENSYPLTINGTMQDGHNFSFTVEVKIQ